MIPQWRTQQILHDRLAELGGSVEFGIELVALARESDQVTAELVRSDGSSFTVTAQYLIAADGGHSVVRQAPGIPMTGAEVGLRATVVADVLDLSTRLYRTGRTPEVGSAVQADQRGRMTNQLRPATARDH
ncbi:MULTISPECIES: FAD-dependent monooxygenase [unclassified Streptomyces]|uniref:FAD-dependent monooxygenase n=1 Tax=unclassified Streptomyces TaxID=2593676 RepID=UPI00380065C8